MAGPVDASEELQRLDADLADGRVDATAYRRRRDALVVRRREEEAAARTAAGARKNTPREPSPSTGPVAVEPVVDGTGSDGVPEEVAPDPLPAAPAADPIPVTPEAADPIPVTPPSPHPLPVTPPAADPLPPTADPPTDTFPVVPPLPPRAPGPPAPPPGTAPPAADPFPPPFRWGPTPVREAPDADVTRVVPDIADRTQAVPPSTFQPPTFATPERTQVVPGTSAGRRPSAPVPASRTTPPWVERPPERPDPSSGIAGSDVFFGGRRDLASTLGTLAVVVVVILILVLSFTVG